MKDGKFSLTKRKCLYYSAAINHMRVGNDSFYAGSTQRMEEKTMHNQLFASFILDETNGLEIALKADNVTEATLVNGTIQKLPACIDYLEGIMTLREDVIPVINLKKRLGLGNHNYGEEAKVAVVSIHNQNFGLLFDDIREVFRAESENIMPVNSMLQTDDRIISAIIKLENGARTVELLDLGHLFKGQSFDMADSFSQERKSSVPAKKTTYSRWVVFTCFNQLYAVPVQYAQEIAFFSKIDDNFKNGSIEGTIHLRGSTIPVMSGRCLLTENSDDFVEQSDDRVLVLSFDECSFGMIVDDINEIITMADDKILPVPSSGSENLLGIYLKEKSADIMLLDMPNLVCAQIDDIKSLYRISGDRDSQGQSPALRIRSRHLITENCYLIFSIYKNFAIELKDVQEIIESEDLLRIPRATGYIDAVINLRGDIVPVVNIRNFYGYPDAASTENKLIICRGQARTVALEIDNIVTIFKQEEYYPTPSVNPRLSEKKDTLDRLIEFETEDGVKEHVLVINMHNLVRNHLEFKEISLNHEIITETETETIKS